MFLVAALSLLVIGLVYPELMNSDIPSTVANIGGWKSGEWGVGGLHMVHGFIVDRMVVFTVGMEYEMIVSWVCVCICFIAILISYHFNE